MPLKSQTFQQYSFLFFHLLCYLDIFYLRTMLVDRPALDVHELSSKYRNCIELIKSL